MSKHKYSDKSYNIPVPSNTLNISCKSLVSSLATVGGSDHSPEKGFAEKLSTLGNGRTINEK